MGELFGHQKYLSGFRVQGVGATLQGMSFAIQAALRQDILATLRSWKPHLPNISRIFISAPGSNEAVLFEEEVSPLSKGDPRIARIPFVTRRPTLSEAKRVLTLLLTVTEPPPASAPPPLKVSKHIVYYYQILQSSLLSAKIACFQAGLLSCYSGKGKFTPADKYSRPTDSLPCDENGTDAGIDKSCLCWPY